DLAAVVEIPTDHADLHLLRILGQVEQAIRVRALGLGQRQIEILRAEADLGCRQRTGQQEQQAEQEENSRFHSESFGAEDKSAGVLAGVLQARGWNLQGDATFDNAVAGFIQAR